VQGAGVAWVCGASVEVVGWGAEETLLAEGMVARNPLTRAATCSLRVASSAAVSSLRGLGAGEARLAQGYGEVTQAGTLLSPVDTLAGGFPFVLVPASRCLVRFRHLQENIRFSQLVAARLFAYVSSPLQI